MKKTLSIILAAAVLSTPSVAAAQPLQLAQPLDFYNLGITKQPKTQSIIVQPKETPKPVTEPKAPEPVVYSVVEGDNLTKIGTAHNVEWQRLWAKNTTIAHPDRINVGDQIIIPLADEVLSRELPAVVSLPAITPGVSHTAAPRASYSYDASNTYDYGYCTWYVKNRRGASLPNMLGNANTWYSRAAAAGMSVGGTPRAGAVGTTTRGSLGHVVYVESVNADGSINISEMNAPVFGGVTYRTASAGEFDYIY